jgi:hypothetical protein
MIDTRPENCKHLMDFDYLMGSVSEGMNQDCRKRFARNSKIREVIQSDDRKTANQKTSHIITIFLLGMIEETV